MNFKYVFIGLICCFLNLSYSESKNRVEIEIATSEIDRSLILEKALNEVSVNFVKQFLGEKRFKSEEEKIKETIIKNKDRYILFSKAGKSIEQEDSSYLTNVTIGVSEKNLQNLLVENELFYKSEGASCLLPIVAFKSKVNKKSGKYIWWKKSMSPNQSLIETVAKDFYSLLYANLIQNKFHSFDPVFSKAYEGLPKDFLPRGSRVSQFSKLSKFLSCDIVLSGTIEVVQEGASYSSDVDLLVFNIKTKQNLFKLNKRIVLDSVESDQDLSKAIAQKWEGLFNSVGFQLSSYKDKGSLDLNRLMISVQGPLNYYQKEKLKQSLLKKVPSIKHLQERLLASNKIIYEAEISSSASSVVSDLQKRSDKKFNIQVTGHNAKKLNIYATEK